MEDSAEVWRPLAGKKKSFFKGLGTQKLDVPVRKNHTSPYAAWCKQVAPHLSPPKHIYFAAAGQRAPLNTPAHPARLDIVRQMAQTWPSPLSSRNDASLFAATQGSTGLDAENAWGELPRTFSGECCLIVTDQSPVELFEVTKVYQDCELFSRCSPGFLQELVTVGGSPSCHGLSFNCGAELYAEGEAGSSLFVLVRGTVLLTQKCSQEPPRALRHGDTFGVAEGLGVTIQRQESAEARTSVQVLEVSLSTLTKILTGSPFGASFTPFVDFEESVPRPQTSPTVAFATERRHFEQEARRLWHQFRGKKFRRPRITSMPISDDGAEALSVEESSNPSRMPSRSSNLDRKRLGVPVNEECGEILKGTCDFVAQNQSGMGYSFVTCFTV